MRTKTLSRNTLGALTLVLLGLAPLSAQAAFCPLGLLLPGSSSCESGGSCPTRQGADDTGGPFRKLLGQIDARQSQQIDRIQMGVDDGRLTARDTQRLMREQCRIQHLQQRAMADGFLSPYEWADLENAQEEAGREIRSLTGMEAGRG